MNDNQADRHTNKNTNDPQNCMGGDELAAVAVESQRLVSSDTLLQINNPPASDRVMWGGYMRHRVSCGVEWGAHVSWHCRVFINPMLWCFLSPTRPGRRGRLFVVVAGLLHIALFVWQVFSLNWCTPRKRHYHVCLEWLPFRRRVGLLGRVVMEYSKGKGEAEKKMESELWPERNKNEPRRHCFPKQVCFRR